MGKNIEMKSREVVKRNSVTYKSFDGMVFSTGIVPRESLLTSIGFILRFIPYAPRVSSLYYRNICDGPCRPLYFRFRNH